MYGYSFIYIVSHVYICRITCSFLGSFVCYLVEITDPDASDACIYVFSCELKSQIMSFICHLDISWISRRHPKSGNLFVFPPVFSSQQWHHFSSSC